MAGAWVGGWMWVGAWTGGRVCVSTLYTITKSHTHTHTHTHPHTQVDETVVPHSSVVKLLGLKGVPELNGRRGVVVDIDHDAERYQVQLEAERVVKVRFRNALA